MNGFPDSTDSGETVTYKPTANGYMANKENGYTRHTLSAPTDVMNKEDEEEDEDDPQRNGIVISKFPTRYNRRESKSSLYNVKEGVEQTPNNDFILDIPSSSHIIFDDDTETTANSPVSSTDTLKNEFRFLTSDNKDVQVHQDLSQRRLHVTVYTKNEHKIKLVIEFPLQYPDGKLPKFHFDNSTTLDKQQQGRLIDYLIEEASPLVNKNKACVSKCINRLKTEIEKLEEADSYQRLGINNNMPSLSLNLSSVPFPRTCGVHFCNDRLVTFQRAIHTTVHTPRSLDDNGGRSYLSMMMPRSPKDNHFSRKSSKQKAPRKEKSGPVRIYNISTLLPYSKDLASQYKIEPTVDSCKFNAEVALANGRKDVYQIWLILAELIDSKLNVDGKSIDFKIPYAHLPFGRTMIQSIIEHYASLGDFQTLSMVCCMFPYNQHVSIADTEKPALQTLPRTSSTVKLINTSPASSLTGRSPPDRSAIDHFSTDVLNGWQSASLRRRDTESLQEMKPTITEPETELQKHRTSIMMLNPDHSLMYDYFKDRYADALYKWRSFVRRGQLLKTSSSPPLSTHITFCTICALCGSSCTAGKCVNCKVTALQCALCRGVVKGLVTVCRQCWHGGHTEHMKLWFDSCDVCPTGCGCNCLDYNTKEICIER